MGSGGSGGQTVSDGVWRVWWGLVRGGSGGVWWVYEPDRGRAGSGGSGGSGRVWWVCEPDLGRAERGWGCWGVVTGLVGLRHHGGGT